MERLPVQPESKTESFEEQFSNLKEVQLPSGTAEVADCTPENLKDEMPVFLAPAWGLGLDTYKSAIEQLFKDERRVVSLTHPRIGGALDSSMDIKGLSRAKEWPLAELRKALNILEVLEELGIEKVDAIAHSESAINIAMAATMYPEKFRSIVFYAPAGMMEKENWPRLAKGFASQGTRAPSLKDIPINESEREASTAAKWGWLKYLAKNPGRGISEISAIKNGHAQTKDLLPYLHDIGINIAVISAVDDPVFPPEEIRKAAEIDAVDTFVSTMPGGHGMLGDHPEIAMPIAERLLERFATREKTPQQKKALASREYQAGVRYKPGEGLVISEYVKKGRPRESSGV